MSAEPHRTSHALSDILTLGEAVARRPRSVGPMLPLSTAELRLVEFEHNTNSDPSVM